MHRVVVAVLLSVLVASCATRNDGDVASFEKAPLFGMIYDEDNQPCAGARLIVDNRAINSQTGLITDIRGRFLLPDLGRGLHTVVARKEGYEELSVQIQFLNRTDVLFLRMVSYGQLLTGAEKALEERKWDQADAYLARAQRLDPQDNVLLYMRAVKAYKTGKFDEALSNLNGILSQGVKDPLVFLFLADVYEKQLNDRKKAIENLEAYLERRADAEAEKRLADLKAGEMKKD